MCLIFVCFICMDVVNSTHRPTVLREWKWLYIIRYLYIVQFNLGDHLANGTTFA